MDMFLGHFTEKSRVVRVGPGSCVTVEMQLIVFSYVKSRDSLKTDLPTLMDYLQQIDTMSHLLSRKAN